MLHTYSEGERVRALSDVAANRLGQNEAHLTVCDILGEASTDRPEFTAEGGRRWRAVTQVPPPRDFVRWGFAKRGFPSN
jgi:hypothetical protein